MHIAAEPFDLKDTMDATFQLFKPAAAEKGLNLRIELSPDIPETIMGDPARLQQVFTNLVGNAIKFTDKGYVAFKAELLNSNNPDQIRLLFTVSDSGIGLADHLTDRIFAPFTQAETSFSRKFQGAGLGLTITKRLVTLMGGTIGVDSEEGRGAVFHFSLPFEKADRPADDLRPQEEPFALNKLKILMVEDDRISAVSTKRLLEKLDHTVVIVDDGRPALEALKAEPFDLVLMDIQLPRLDGMEATRALRRGKAGETNANVPVVAMTAYAMDGDRERFLAAGMDGYAAKPMVLEELKAAMVDALKKRR